MQLNIHFEIDNIFLSGDRENITNRKKKRTFFNVRGVRIGIQLLNNLTVHLVPF